MPRIPAIPLLFVLLFPVAGSCYTSRMELNVLLPGDIILPSSIQSVTVLPMPGLPSSEGKFDSLNILSPNGQPELIKMGYLHGLYDIISTSPRFFRVVLTSDNTDSYLKKQRLYWDDLQNICAQDSTDAVLVLTRAVSREFVTTSQYKIVNKTRWIFYKPRLEQIGARYDFSDTVELDGSTYYNDVSGALYDACYTTGENSAKKLAPYWQSVSRILFRGPGNDLRDAAGFAMKNRWYNAGLLWNDLVYNKNIRIASKAAFNLGVAFERDDDLQQAYSWVSYADSLDRNEYTALYKRVLEIRMKNKPLIDQQLTGK